MRHSILGSALIGAAITHLATAAPSSQHARVRQSRSHKTVSTRIVTSPSTAGTDASYTVAFLAHSATDAPTATNSTMNKTSTSAGGWKWMGVDESGPEFGDSSIPGTYNEDFIFPSTDSIKASRPNNLLLFIS